MVPLNGHLPLSKSEAQRLALLRCLVTQPAIVILDEALSEMREPDEINLVATLHSLLEQSIPIGIQDTGIETDGFFRLARSEEAT